MVTIDIEMPTDCASCWIRLNIGCRIANESGWLNNRRDEQCPLKELVQCKDCKYAYLTSDGECKYCDMEKDDNGSLVERYCSWDWFCADGERRTDDA